MKNKNDRDLELLSDRALEGLDAGDVTRLSPEARTNEELDLAAAAVDLAFAANDDAPLPAHLARKIAAGADAHFASQPKALQGDARPRSSRASAQMTTGAAGAQVIVMPLPEAAAPRGFDVTRWSGWLAAAACLALLVGQSIRARTEVARPAPAAASSLSAPAPAGGAADVVEIPFAAQGVAGVVVWSPAAHAGTLRIRGLTPNDPATSRYQLWIRDAAHDARYPISAALFDVPPAGEAVVAVDPKLPAGLPTEISITREAPGGVVVSAREQLVLAVAVALPPR